MIGIRSAASAALFLFLGAFPATAATPVRWAIPDAPYRAVVKLSVVPSIPEAGIAITLPEFGATMETLGDVVMTDTNGEVQPLTPVWRGSGVEALLLAKEMKKDEEYFVYFGGNHPRNGVTWPAITSLLMETRHLSSSGSFEAWPAMDTTWRNAGESEGAEWVRSINQGVNPFGDNRRFLTHYTGYLRTDKMTQVTLFTVSSDASFVVVNGVYEFGWPGEHSPVSSSKSPHSKSVAVTGPLTRIDYYQAKTAQSQPAMVLGWEINGKPVTIPEDAWVHPGVATLVRLEEFHGFPAPVPVVRVRSYIGFENQWLYEINAKLLGKVPEGWTVQWRFSDGVINTNKECTHVVADTSLQNVVVKLQRGLEEMTGGRRIRFTDEIPAASIQYASDMRSYLDAMAHENLAELPMSLLRSYIAFLNSIDDRIHMAPLADAWLKRNPDTGDALWLPAQLSRLRAQAQTDPRGALAELRAIPPGPRVKYSTALDLLELDILVFHLHDASAVDRAAQIAMRDPKSETARLALVRAGDYFRLQGRYPEAIAQYQQAQRSVVDGSDGRMLPAQDRAYSMTIQDLLENDEISDAEKKLTEWESRHPLAKLDSDFLILRSRVLMGLGRWREALEELESFEKLQPDSPFQIDADFYRAQAMFELGQKPEARKIWKEIITKYPQYPMIDQCREWMDKQ
jgi:tetratricopeptide (TPR) repeat protein